MMRWLLPRLAVLLLLPLLLSCDRQSATVVDSSNVADGLTYDQQARKEDVLYFGFDIRGGIQEDARQYLPLLSYLEKETGLKFSIRFTQKNSSTGALLGQGRLDFAAIGAASFIKNRQLYPIVSLVRGLSRDDQSRYRSYLVVRRNSQINQLNDVKGKVFAFGDRASTQGHLIPRIVLRQNGIELQDLAKYFYTHSHRDCAEAVINMKADICGMQDTLASEMEASGQLRILHKSDFYPSSGIASNQNVDPVIRDKVKKALLNFQPRGKDKKGLYNWELTEMSNGFSDANDSDYSDLEQWMKSLELMN